MSDFKITLEISSIQWTGENYKEICNFVGIEPERGTSELFNDKPSNLFIPTLNGIQEVRALDVISKDNFGNIYIFSRGEANDMGQ